MMWSEATNARTQWKTREGEWLDVCVMDDRHLLNAASMMERNFTRAMTKLVVAAATPVKPEDMTEDNDPEELRERAEWCRAQLDMLDAEGLRRWSL